MAELACPECGCDIGGESCEYDGVVYCCEPCATGCECECGCCDEEEEEYK